MADAASADPLRPVAAGLVHKLRNSLNAMRTHVALLQRFLSAPASANVTRQVEKLERAVLGMEEQLQEFLAFADPPRSDGEEVDLVRLIDEVVDFEAGELEQARIMVVSEYAPGLPEVCVDRNRFKRAVLNLVINARQAMTKGGRLTVRARAPSHEAVVVEISDTGSGISGDSRASVFEPFFSTRPGGLGLGLAQAKRTVEDFGGEIGFESDPGQGTTFRLVLPSARHWRTLAKREAEHLQPAR